MSPKPDVRKERVAQIREAAAKVFAEKGFDEARMDDIASESGLSKGTIYWYFNSKEELINDVLDEFFDQELNLIEQMSRLDTPARDKLNSIIDMVIKDLHRLQAFMPIIYEFYALAFRKKFIKKIISNYYKKYMQSLTPVIQDGIDSGEFQEVNAHDTAIALGAIIEGTLLFLVFDPESVDFDKNIRFGANLILDAIATSKKNALIDPGV